MSFLTNLRHLPLLLLATVTAAIPIFAEDVASFPPGTGRDVFIRTCTRCHEASNSTKLRLTRRQWQGKVYQQADRGAEVSGEDLDLIVDYLAKNFGPEATDPEAGRPEVKK